MSSLDDFIIKNSKSHMLEEYSYYQDKIKKTKEKGMLYLKTAIVNGIGIVDIITIEVDTGNTYISYNVFNEKLDVITKKKLLGNFYNKFEK